jgi:hypothetical protein
VTIRMDAIRLRASERQRRVYIKVPVFFYLTGINLRCKGLFATCFDPCPCPWLLVFLVCPHLSKPSPSASMDGAGRPWIPLPRWHCAGFLPRFRPSPCLDCTGG